MLENLNLTELITQLGLGGAILLVGREILKRLLDQADKRDEKIADRISNMHATVKESKKVQDESLEIQKDSASKLTRLVDLQGDRGP